MTMVSVSGYGDDSYNDDIYDGIGVGEGRRGGAGGGGDVHFQVVGQ